MFTIAKATVADSRDIARVYVDTWRATYPGMLPDRVLVGMSSERQSTDWLWLIRNRSQSVPVLVARVPGVGVVGFTSCGPSRAADRLKVGPLANIAGEVFTLYVKPDFQNQGIGRRLLSGSFAALRERNYAGAFLWVLSHSPSRFFYERVGGRCAAERRERLWGADVDEMAYAWPDLACAIDRIGSCSTSE
jgi:ribosomal protein S18 acetylase RimI-like enzyme